MKQARKPHDGRTPGNPRPQPYHQGAALEAEMERTNMEELEAASGVLDWLTGRSEEESP